MLADQRRGGGGLVSLRSALQRLPYTGRLAGRPDGPYTSLWPPLSGPLRAPSMIARVTGCSAPGSSSISGFVAA